MFSRHRLLHLVEIVGITLALVLVGFGVGVASRARRAALPVSKGAIRVSAGIASVAVQQTPNPSCNPSSGEGAMGICFPRQGVASADALAIAAGDPTHITGLLGVDVSSYNPCQIRRGITFVYVKASEGASYTNPNLSCQIRSARAAHDLFGVYDFIRPGRSSATIEAQHFIAAARSVHAISGAGVLPPVADVEVSDGQDPARVAAYVAQWVAAVKRATGRRAIIYTGAWFWNPAVASASPDHAALWVSGYATNPLLPSAWRRWTFWQYSDGVYGPTPHLGGDSDTFNGSRTSLNLLAGIRVVKPTPRPSSCGNRPKVSRLHAIVVCVLHHAPAARAGYILHGRGDGWWEYLPDRSARPGARLMRRSKRKPHAARGYRRVLPLGDQWWESVR